MQSLPPCESVRAGHRSAMVAIPWQRPSHDRWTVTLAPSESLSDAIDAAAAAGWSVVSASRVSGGVELVLRR